MNTQSENKREDKPNNAKNSAKNSARNNILAKLKQEVEGADYTKLPPEPTFDYPELAREVQIDNFIKHLVNNHAQVIRISKPQITENIEKILFSLNIDSLMYGKNSLYSDEIETIVPQIALSDFDFVLETQKDRLFNQTPASVTSSYAAIAATGSIVLWPSINEPRTLSLVPPVHIVVVDANRMFCDFATLIKEQQWQTKLPTNVLLISGPSKTADIQQTLAYGAHGPEKLFVLLLNS